MIKSLFRRNLDFNQIYDNALSKRECEILINQFEKSDKKFVGETSDGYRPGEKKCTQLYVDLRDHNVVSTIVKPNLISCIKKYKKKYREYVRYTSRWRYYNEVSF